MGEELYNLLSIVVSAASSVVAICMFALGAFQLRKLAIQAEESARSNRISRLNALISIENKIQECRRDLALSGIEVAKLKNSCDDEFEAKKLRFDEAKQVYLNSLDRLCFCIIKGYLDEEEMKPEYRGLVNESVKDFKSDFEVGTKYRNILKIYDNWSES